MLVFELALALVSVEKVVVVPQKWADSKVEVVDSGLMLSVRR